MQEIEIKNEINNNLNISNKQKNFLETNIGTIINKGLNIGLKYVLPNIIEDQVIDIKDTIIENGFSEGVKKAIDSAIELGKSTVGIVTGNFENVNQVQNAIKNGGIIDSISEILDFAVKKGVESGRISENIGKTISRGKNTILNTISNNIENSFELQLDNIEKLNKYVNNWKNYYQNKNFDGMQNEYRKIQEKIKDIIPLENTIKEVRKVENIHNLIKNNGKNFNLSVEEIEIAKNI